MAIDWTQGSKGGSRGGKNTAMPSKTTMNLMVRDSGGTDVRKVIPLVLLAALLIALFAKFGVIDFYGQTTQKADELAAVQDELAQVQARISGYDAVESEYNRYESSAAFESDDVADAMAALALVDGYVARVATVNSIDLRGTTMTLNLSNTTLERLGKLSSDLYEQPTVESVALADATNTADGTGYSATMTVKLVPASGTARTVPDAATATDATAAAGAQTTTTAADATSAQ